MVVELRKMQPVHVVWLRLALVIEALGRCIALVTCLDLACWKVRGFPGQEHCVVMVAIRSCMPVILRSP